MTFEEFAKYELAMIERVVAMNHTKGREYTVDSVNRFSNFNEEADDAGVERLKVAEIFLNKHIRAIKSFIKYGHELSEENIQGRVVDAVKYLLLIGGMIYEDQSNPNFNEAKEKVNDSMYQMQQENRKTQSYSIGGLGGFRG